MFVQSVYDNYVHPLTPAPPTLEPSKTVDDLFTVLRPKFNPATDLLLISESDLDEARLFDTDGWLSSISDHMFVLSDDLKNTAIVRSGYAGGLF